MSKLTFAVLNFKTQKPPNCQSNIKLLFCCSTLCTPILSVFLWLWCNCWKASYKGSLLIRERYSFRLSWVFLNFPILPFDVRLRVFLQRKVCIFTKRQSLLIYQTYQPASQTDSTRQLEFLKSFKILFQVSDEILLPFFIFCLTWQSCKQGKKRGHAAVSDILAVIHVFCQLAWQSAHSIKY